MYNKILTHRNKDSYANRRYAPSMDEVMGGSNYLPALQKARELLELGSHGACAISMFFFSDGRSTDHKKLGITAEESYKQMNEVITSMASYSGESLTVSMVGLGDVHDQFLPLKEMANAASTAGAKGSLSAVRKLPIQYPLQFHPWSPALQRLG